MDISITHPSSALLPEILAPDPSSGRIVVPPRKPGWLWVSEEVKSLDNNLYISQLLQILMKLIKLNCVVLMKLLLRRESTKCFLQNNELYQL